MEFQELCEVGLQRQDIYDGAVLHVVRDKVMLPNGKESHREFCLHVGAVSVIPILSDGRVIMERQFRYAHGRVFLAVRTNVYDWLHKWEASWSMCSISWTSQVSVCTNEIINVLLTRLSSCAIWVTR